MTVSSEAAQCEELCKCRMRMHGCQSLCPTLGGGFFGKRYATGWYITIMSPSAMHRQCKVQSKLYRDCLLQVMQADQEAPTSHSTFEVSRSRPEYCCRGPHRSACGLIGGRLGAPANRSCSAWIGHCQLANTGEGLNSRLGQ